MTASPAINSETLIRAKLAQLKSSKSRCIRIEAQHDTACCSEIVSVNLNVLSCRESVSDTAGKTNHLIDGRAPGNVMHNPSDFLGGLNSLRG